MATLPRPTTYEQEPLNVKGLGLSATTRRTLSVRGTHSPAGAVNAGVPIVCLLTQVKQKAGGFAPGQFVGFDVMEGATFTQVC